jgi:hypothetical protein
MLLGEAAQHLGTLSRDATGDAGGCLLLAHAPSKAAQRVQRTRGFRLQPQGKPASAHGLKPGGLRRPICCHRSPPRKRTPAVIR